MSTALPQALSAARVDWLPAEASARRYARLTRPTAVDRPSAIAMVFARGTPPAEVSRVERATRLLADAGLPVPTIFAVDPEELWILQEDLGNVTLAAARVRGDGVASAYSEAVQLLDRLEGLNLPTSPRPPLNASRLRQELNVFAAAALGLSEGPGPDLAADFDRIVDAALADGSRLCHRDYHSRNLLIHEGRVRVVDHQDALAGPIAYDRVSLAYDPYVDLSDSIRDRIAGSGDAVGATAVQRLAKAIGTFAEKGGAWRPFIGPAARQARRLLPQVGAPCPLIDLAFASLAAGADTARAAT